MEALKAPPPPRAAAMDLGIAGFDSLNEASLDGRIDGRQLSGVQLTDRFFIEIVPNLLEFPANTCFRYFFRTHPNSLEVENRSSIFAGTSEKLVLWGRFGGKFRGRFAASRLSNTQPKSKRRNQKHQHCTQSNHRTNTSHRDTNSPLLNLHNASEE